MVFLLTAVNFVVGLVANATMRGHGAGLKLTAHMPLGIVVMVLAAIAAVITFGRSRSGELSPIMRWHPVLSVLALALTLTMGFLTALPFIFK
jgi:cytochrome c biogenesis protein CcdA